MDAAISSEALRIGFLTRQIKSNAGLLFSHMNGVDPQLSYDIVVTTIHSPPEKGSQTRASEYQAILTYRSGIKMSQAAAAMGGAQGTVVEAYDSLFHVLAAALERYQGNVLKSMASPNQTAGGVIDGKMMR